MDLTHKKCEHGIALKALKWFPLIVQNICITKFFISYEFYENKTLYVLKAYLNGDTQLISDSVKVEPSLTHLPLDKMAHVLQTIFLEAFSWKFCILT